MSRKTMENQPSSAGGDPANHATDNAQQNTSRFAPEATTQRLAEWNNVPCPHRNNGGSVLT